MAGFRIVLPLFLLGLIEVKATNNQGLTYYDALTMAVTFFNKETDEKNSFWFTAAEPPPDWNNTSREPHHLSFTAKETDCLRTENITPVTCAFKENGREKYCQGIITDIDEKEANVWVKCVPLASRTPVRAKRRVPDILKKIAKKIVKEAIKKGVSEVLKEKPSSPSKSKQ